MTAERATIVVGILLAFGIQAWWEGRIEGAQRDALLASLASDFELAAIDLARVRGYYEHGIAATAALLQLPRRGSRQAMSARESTRC